MPAAEITRPQSHARDRNHAHGSFATHARARSSAHTEIAVALMDCANVSLADNDPPNFGIGAVRFADPVLGGNGGCPRTSTSAALPSVERAHPSQVRHDRRSIGRVGHLTVPELEGLSWRTTGIGRAR